MGLAGLEWCHFVVYVYSGMIIVKVAFNRDYFKYVIDNMNNYYKDYYINELLSRVNNESEFYIVTNNKYYSWTLGPLIVTISPFV